MRGLNGLLQQVVKSMWRTLELSILLLRTCNEGAKLAVSSLSNSRHDRRNIISTVVSQ